MSTFTLKLLEETFAIHSLARDVDIPKAVFDAPIFFIAKTYEETSIVLPQTVNIISDEIERDWQALEVVGPLDFTLTGILSKISTILANEKISIFAISTFDTDYILVKSQNVSLATTALLANDYQII
ncbi:MAG: hypothetical protein ACJAXS_002203 [Colwellia sp.]|jgi:hypothetical protein